MISIENGNLELALSWLFAAILDLSVSVGQAIYLTPKSAFARLEILENAAKAYFHVPSTLEAYDRVRERYANDLSRTLAILKRCQKVIGKRHSIMHDGWGSRDDGQEVVRASFPIPPNSDQIGEHVPLSELEKTVSQFRSLIDDVRDLTTEFARNHVDFRLAAAGIDPKNPGQIPG